MKLAICLFFISCLILIASSQKIPRKEECPPEAVAFVDSPIATNMWVKKKNNF